MKLRLRLFKIERFLNLLETFQREQFEGVMETFWKQSRGHLADIFKANYVKSRWKRFKTGLLNVFTEFNVSNVNT